MEIIILMMGVSKIMARLIDNKYENMFRWMSNKLKIQD